MPRIYIEGSEILNQETARMLVEELKQRLGYGALYLNSTPSYKGIVIDEINNRLILNAPVHYRDTSTYGLLHFFEKEGTQGSARVYAEVQPDPAVFNIPF